jgi:hypothetical protein
MKTKAIVWTLALCFVAVAVCFASPQIGTWKLNEAKSKLNPAMAKNTTVVYEVAGDKVKVIVDGTDPAGKPAHNEWTGKFDANDYPVTGDANQSSRSYKEVDANTLDMIIKKDGKASSTGQIVVAADGKTRTVTISGTDAKGAKFTSIAVYDKQ